MFRYSNRHPSAHGIADKVRAIVSKIVDDGDDVFGALPLAVILRIGGLVAQAMAKRVHTGDTVFVPECADEAILFPTPGAAKKAMLEDNERPFSLDCVVDLLSAARDEWHVASIGLSRVRCANSST
jgi:hypothetical protein